MLVLSLFLACGAPDADTDATPPGPQTQGSQGGGDAGDDPGGDGGADGGDDDLPSEYIYEDDPEQPLLTLDQVADATSEAVAAFSELDPADFFNAYDEARQQQDDDCPYYIPDYEDLYGYWYWYDSCSSGSGANWSGYAYGIVYEPYWSGDYKYTDHGWIYGDFAVDLPDGQELDFSGYSYNYRYQYRTGSVGWYGSITGDVIWTGDDFEDTWLTERWSLSFTTSSWSSGDPSSSSRSLSGGISGLSGVANAIVFDEVWLGTELGGSSCPEEPSGVVRIRDDAGDWYELLFHGPSESGGSTFPEDCDGCGEVWFRGSYLGESCPSFTPLNDWQGVTP